jgi:hypothetical protein
LVGDTEHYEISRKTNIRKGEQMKRLALLSVFSMLLASVVFAPVAMAQELAPGEVVVQSVTLGPGGSVTVTGITQCVTGYYPNVNIEVRQKTSGNVNNIAGFGPSLNVCVTDGPIAFSATGFGHVGELEKPFHRGPATIHTWSYLYDPSFSTYIPWDGGLAAVNIR